MDDQTTDRKGSESINAGMTRVVLGFAVFVVAFVLMPAAESLGATATFFVTVTLLAGASIVGSGVLMPFGLPRWGAALGFVLLLALMVFTTAITIGK
jgi:hypothetical protein